MPVLLNFLTLRDLNLCKAGTVSVKSTAYRNSSSTSVLRSAGLDVGCIKNFNAWAEGEGIAER